MSKQVHPILNDYYAKIAEGMRIDLGVIDLGTVVKMSFVKDVNNMPIEEIQRLQKLAENK